MGKVWLITGGLGFIGTNLRIRLKSEGKHIIVVDNKRYDTGYRGDDPIFYQTDITRFSALEKVFKRHKPDYLVHLAARTDVRETIDNPYVCFEENVLGTMNCLELAKRYKCEMSLVASSCGVVGEKFGPIDENTSCDPKSPYASSKLCIEIMSDAYRSCGLDICTLRLTNLYGPWSLQKSSVIPTFIKKCIDKEVLLVNGSGNQTRNFFYVEDAVEAIVKCVESKANLLMCAGHNSSSSINDLIITLSDIFDVPINVIHSPPIAGEVINLDVNCYRLFQTVNFHIKNSLLDGLKKTIDWYKSNYGGL